MSNPAGEGDLLRSGWQARSRQEKVGARDKMQPSLLDRLTDNDPEKKRESANSNLITHAALRRNVLRADAGEPFRREFWRRAAGGEKNVRYRMARHSAQAHRSDY